MWKVAIFNFQLAHLSYQTWWIHYHYLYFTARGNCCWWKLLLGKLVTGEVVVGEIGGWGNCCWEICCWGNWRFEKLLLGKLAVWEIAVGEIGCWGNWRLGKLLLGKLAVGEIGWWRNFCWENNLTPLKLSMICLVYLMFANFSSSKITQEDFSPFSAFLHFPLLNSKLSFTKQ